MIMKFFRLTILMLVLLAVVSACSWFGKKGPEYLDSVEGQPLKIPEGLDRPSGARPVVIAVPLMRMPAGDELKPVPPRVVNTSGRRDTNSHMAWSAEGVYLFVADTSRSVARRLGYAIAHSGMNMLEKDAAGAHKFQYTQERIDKEGFFRKIMFWRDGPPDYSGTYRLGLQKDGKNTRVYLYEANGKSADTETSEQILGIFMERLG